MVVRGRITPIAVMAGLIIMIVALVYVVVNHAHSLPSEEAPLHQSK